MVKMQRKSMKERLWPAGIAALVLHSLMIAAIALGLPYPQGMSPQDFRAEVMFTSPLVGEVNSEQREEASEAYLPLQTNYQGHNPWVAAHPASTPPLRLRTDLSCKGRGKQPISKLKISKTAEKPVSGGHPAGETNDAFPIFNPPPIYPDEAKRKGMQGVVLVRLSLTETGSVDKATTLSPRIDPLLEEAALNALYKWKFKPGVRTLEVPIEFKLEA